MCLVLLQGHAPLLHYPPQPKDAGMREEYNEVQSLPAPVVRECAGQSSSGNASVRSAEDEDDDRVLLIQRFKRSRSSAPEGGADLATPVAGQRNSSAPSMGAHPPRDGHKKLKTDWRFA